MQNETQKIIIVELVNVKPWQGLKRCGMQYFWHPRVDKLA
jgi:hypothetical protein